MDSDIHDQIEDRTQGGDPCEVEQNGQRDSQDNGVYQHMSLDIARHAKMVMGNKLHIGKHGRHSGHRKYTCHDPGNRGHNSDAYRKPKTIFAKGRF